MEGFEQGTQTVGEGTMQDPFSIDLGQMAEIGELVPDIVDELSGEEPKPKPEEVQADNEDKDELVDKKEEVKTEEEDKKEDPSSKDTKNSSPLIPYAKLVKEEGLLPNFNIDEWDGSAEGFVDAINQEVELGVNNYKETLPPQVKWLADNLDDGVPLQKLLEIDNQRFELSNITEDALQEDSVQKNVVRQFYKETTRFTDEQINKAIERLETTGELEEESKSSLEALKEINAQKEQQERQAAIERQKTYEKERQETVQKFKDNIEQMDEVIPGVKVSRGLKDQVFNALMKPVGQTEDGQYLNELAYAARQNPLEVETKLMYIWKATKGLKDFSVFGSSGKKQAIKEFEDTVSNMDFNKTTQQNQYRTGGSDTSLIDDMVAATEIYNREY